MNERKSSNGITLIALIIMVIILLVLTAVTFDIIIDGDFFGKAQNTVTQANAQMQDQDEQATEIKNVWDDIPGKIIQSGTKENTTIKINAVTSVITKNSFRVNARGTNAEGEVLSFTLTVNGHNQVFEAKTGEEVYWDVTGLEMNTTYEFTVIATDGETENSVTGSETTLSNSAPTVSATVSRTETTATITATGKDADGDTLKYALTVKNGTSVVASYELDGQNEWTINNLTENTTYSYSVTVSDGTAESTSSGTFKTLIGNSAPVIAYNYDYKGTTNAKTTTKFTIAMSATDTDGDTLNFELLVSTAQSGKYYTAGTITASSGETKTIPVTSINGTSLTEYGKYWWKLKVTDGNGGEVTSSPLSLRTYCSGESTAYATFYDGEEWVSCGSCGGTRIGLWWDGRIWGPFVYL